jgi:1-acyl-sn-glycerol-3-phosphate acyltransferase
MTLRSTFTKTMETERFIDIQRLVKSKSPRLAKWLPGFVFRYLKRILHQDEINAFIEKNGHLYDAEFCEEVIRYFNITIQIEGMEKVPSSGPVIITMNHPLGGMDAVAFVAATKEYRKDLRFIVNDLLMNMKNLSGLFVGVNKHGKNDGSVRQQISDAFESDSALVIFPAGLVSRKIKGKVRDLEWKKTFINYAKKFDQPIVPIYIDGSLSPFFYRLSRFRKFLGIKTNIEMLYLADELFKQRNKTMVFRVGDPIYINHIYPKGDDRELAQMVRGRVYELANDDE